MNGFPMREGDATSPFVPEWVFEHAAIRPDQVALASPASRVTWAQCAMRVRRLARLLEQRGVGEGDHVFSALPAAPGAVIASLATQLRGAVSVELARSFGASTHRQVLQRTRPVAAFIDAHDVGTLAPLLEAANVAHVFVYSEDAPPTAVWRALHRRAAGSLSEDGRVDELDVQRWSGAFQVLRRGTVDDRAVEPTPVLRDVDAPALVLFTSGSSGAPVGVVLTHRNLGNARQIASALSLQASDRAMLVLPLSYSYGRSVIHSHLLCGASIYIDHRFLYPRLVIEAMARERTTTFAGVPLTYELLRRHVDPSQLRLPALRQLTQAGGPMNADARTWVRRSFPNSDFYVMYGATEATARLTVLPPAHALTKDGSIGLPIPGVTLRIVDEHGADVPRGEVGQLIARGDNVSPGYLDDPARTAETFRDGWLWTGDLARRDDDGFYFVVGRAREMIKVGGRRASPRTVEDVVQQHPSVEECVAAGIPDAMSGEVVGVAVVVKGGRHLEADALRRFCRAHLPGWLVPRIVHVVPRLPRGDNGKVLRASVADELRAAARAPTTEPARDPGDASSSSLATGTTTTSTTTAPTTSARSVMPPQPGDHT
jgi:long-chain acyl-CoA synthetase